MKRSAALLFGCAWLLASMTGMAQSPAVLNASAAGHSPQGERATALPAERGVPAAVATASNPPPAARLRVGLVLGGGGARGMAHIGILKVLEELHVPVDFIAGTSMGSIVGGVYATGMSASDMEARVLAVDWSDVFDDRLDRANLSMRRKDDSRTPLFRPEFGFRNSTVQLPIGAISGRKLDLLLHELTVPVARQTSFDELPIPFRAIATDLVTGEMVVFNNGYLSQAVRASMSVPGAFDPVEIDGRLLVDGGLVRNVPVDIARTMGAQVVIAIDVGSPNMERNQLNSLGAVLGQMVNINIRKNADESLASLSASDVRITPDLGTIGSSEFTRAKEAIEAGERAARAMAAELSKLSVPASQFAAWRESLGRPERAARRLDFIDITGTDRVNPEVLRSAMRTKPGDMVTSAEIKDDLERLQARGDFEAIDVRNVEDERGAGLRMKFTEKRWGPNFFKFGLGLSSDYQGDASYEFAMRYTRTWVNQLGGEIRGEASVGRLRRAYAELYQPLDLDSTIYVKPYFGVQRKTVNLFDGRQRVAQYDQEDAFAGFAVGNQIFKWTDVSVGARYANSRAIPIIAPPGSPEYDTPYGGYTFRAVYDQMDNFFFPTEGGFAQIDGLLARPSLGSSESTNMVQTSLERAWRIGRSTVLTGINAGRVYNVDDNSLQNLTLGGLFRLSGYRTDQLRGTKLAFGRVLYSYRLEDLPSILGGGVYVGASLEAGNVWKNNQAMALQDVNYSGALFVGVDTAAGPLYFAWGKAPGDNSSLYFYLGRPF